MELSTINHMIKPLSRTVSIVAAILFLVCQAASFARNDLPTVPGISDLGWMVGSWQTNPNGRLVSDERWAPAAGGIIIGMSRSVAGDKLASFESLRIEQRGDAIFSMWPV